MYTIGKAYKIEMPNSIFYTVDILEEDADSIRVVDKFGVELVLSKSRIVQAKCIGDSNGPAKN